MSFLLIMNLCLSIMMMFLKHPLSMGMILLMQTILITLITGLLNFNFWYSYILFLIMIGGMLILFIYMTSIASNEKFNFSIYLYIYMFMSMIISIFSLIFNPLMNFYLKLEKKDFFFYYNISLNKFINNPNNIILFLIIIYLLITLIAIVKISVHNSGPLRQKF
nr:NADH dehydrogenase subunit 6 [Coproporus sp.]